MNNLILIRMFKLNINKPFSLFIYYYGNKIN